MSTNNVSRCSPVRQFFNFDFSKGSFSNILEAIHSPWINFEAFHMNINNIHYFYTCCDNICDIFHISMRMVSLMLSAIHHSGSILLSCSCLLLCGWSLNLHIFVGTIEAWKLPLNNLLVVGFEACHVQKYREWEIGGYRKKGVVCLVSFMWVDSVDQISAKWSFNKNSCRQKSSNKQNHFTTQIHIHGWHGKKQ